MTSRRCTLAGLLVLFPAAAGAQDLRRIVGAEESMSSTAIGVAVPRSCVESLPASAFRPVLVWVTADHPAHTLPARVPRVATVAVRLATEAIAWQARALLGAPEGALPRPDTLATWQNVGRHLHIVAHRDGRINWAYPWDTPQHEPVVDTVALPTLSLLGEAVDSAMANGVRFTWPDDLGGQTLTFLLRLDTPDVDYQGKRLPLDGIASAPLVEIREPVRTPVVPARQPDIRYPEAQARSGIEADLQVQFVVDSSGRPLAHTIRALAGRVHGRSGDEVPARYDEFIREVRSGIARAVFRPARVGGCAVPQLVQQPFTFRVGTPPRDP